MSVSFRDWISLKQGLEENSLDAAPVFKTFEVEILFDVRSLWHFAFFFSNHLFPQGFFGGERLAMYFFLRLEICENPGYIFPSQGIVQERKVMQACCFRQHSRHTVHRVALTAFLAPDRPISQCLPYSLQDQDLFRCNVPRPADWLRAYQACQTASSFDAVTCFGHALGSQKAEVDDRKKCFEHQPAFLWMIGKTSAWFVFNEVWIQMPSYVAGYKLNTWIVLRRWWRSVKQMTACLRELSTLHLLA